MIGYKVFSHCKWSLNDNTSTYINETFPNIKRRWETHLHIIHVHPPKRSKWSFMQSYHHKETKVNSYQPFKFFSTLIVVYFWAKKWNQGSYEFTLWDLHYWFNPIRVIMMLTLTYHQNSIREARYKSGWLTYRWASKKELMGDWSDRPPRAINKKE